MGITWGASRSGVRVCEAPGAVASCHSMAIWRDTGTAAMAACVLAAVGCGSSNGESAQADDAPTNDGTCALVSTTGPVYYPSTRDSPCPEALPTEEMFNGPFCSVEALGEATCVYPAADDPTKEWVCSCEVDGRWGCTQTYCRRTGDDCGAGAQISWPVVELADDCEERPITACATGGTVQNVLDRAVGGALYDCPETGCWLGAVLTVYFEAGCAKSFAWGRASYGWAPAATADGHASSCVEQKLETLRLDCAMDLECGTAEIGSAPLMCQIL